MTKKRIRPGFHESFDTIEGTPLLVRADGEGNLEIDFVKPRMARTLSPEDASRLADALRDAVGIYEPPRTPGQVYFESFPADLRRDFTGEIQVWADLHEDTQRECEAAAASLGIKAET